MEVWKWNTVNLKVSWTNHCGCLLGVITMGIKESTERTLYQGYSCNNIIHTIINYIVCLVVRFSLQSIVQSVSCGHAMTEKKMSWFIIYYTMKRNKVKPPMKDTLKKDNDTKNGQPLYKGQNARCPFFEGFTVDSFTAWPRALQT